MLLKLLIFVGLQNLSKEIKLKKSPAKVGIARPLSLHLSHCNCYNVPKDLPHPATWPIPSCPPLEKVRSPLLTPPHRVNIYPNQLVSVSENPLPSPTNQ